MSSWRKDPVAEGFGSDLKNRLGYLCNPRSLKEGMET